VHIDGVQGRDKVCPVVVLSTVARGAESDLLQDIARHKWALQFAGSASQQVPRMGYSSHSRDLPALTQLSLGFHLDLVHERALQSALSGRAS
jgi:hypothetical protein